MYSVKLKPKLQNANLTLTLTLTICPTIPPSPLRLQASAGARHALTSAVAKLLSPPTLPQLPQLLYPCSHSYCQTRRLLLTVTLTVTLTLAALLQALELVL